MITFLAGMITGTFATFVILSLLAITAGKVDKK